MCELFSLIRDAPVPDLSVMHASGLELRHANGVGEMEQDYPNKKMLDDWSKYPEIYHGLIHLINGPLIPFAKSHPEEEKEVSGWIDAIKKNNVTNDEMIEIMRKFKEFKNQKIHLCGGCMIEGYNCEFNKGGIVFKTPSKSNDMMFVCDAPLGQCDLSQ